MKLTHIAGAAQAGLFAMCFCDALLSCTFAAFISVVRNVHVRNRLDVYNKDDMFTRNGH